MVYCSLHFYHLLESERACEIEREAYIKRVIHNRK